MQPRGNVLGGTAYSTTLDYVSTSNDRVETVTDALGNVTGNSWNPDGTLASQTLPSTGDGITRTTSYASYDANGQPTQVTDAAGGVSRAGYAANGELLWTQDANHASASGGDPRAYRSYFDYDSYGRLGRSSTPKSTSLRPGLLVWTDGVYDANDNVLAQLSPHFGAGDSQQAPSQETVYDELDRPTLETSPERGGGLEQTKTDYDAAGRVVKQTSPLGVRTTGLTKDYATFTGYDLLDRPLTVTGYRVDENDQPLETRTINYCYDKTGDLRSITAPKGASSFTNCPSASATPYVYTSAPYTTELAYDAAHRQTSVTDPLGHETTTDYDENGQVTGVTDPNGNTTTTSYDNRGEKTKTVVPFDPSASPARTLTTKYEYDAIGNLSRLISPRAYDASPDKQTFSTYTTSYGYDALNRQVKTSTLAEQTVYQHSSYDANGNLLSVSLPTLKTTPGTLTASEKTQQSYWDTGQIASSFDGVNPKVRFDYTAEGWQALRLPETALSSGVSDYTRAMVWRYDADGRLLDLADLGGQHTSYGYDANGNQISATEGGVSGSGIVPLTVSASYDGFDQLAKVRVPKAGPANYLTTSFGYDQHANLTQLVQNAEETSSGSVVAAGRTETFTHDNGDQPLTQVDDFATTGTGDDERFSWTYTPLGLEATRKVEKANGGSWTSEQQQTSTYFANGQLQTLTTSNGAGTTVEQHTLSYEDPSGIYVGSRSQDVFKLLGPDTNAPCRTSTCTAKWAYDGRGRLIQEITGTGTTSDYTLDVIGNITQERTNGTVSRTASYNGQQLTSDTVSGTTKKYLYDPDGNLDCITASSWAGGSCPAAGTSALLTDEIYDYRDRLVGSKSYNGAGTLSDSGSYSYDGLDRPVSETETHSGTATTTGFVYVGLANALAQETITGGTNASRSYVYSPDGRRLTLADTTAGTTSRYSYGYDPHGSVSLLLDQANNVKAAYAYSAYGAATTALTKTAAGFNASTNAYRYSGKRYDSGSSTLDMGARRYSAPIARFLQQDLYYGALDNLDLSSDPLTGNRYALAGGNPVGYVENDGHAPIVESGGFAVWKPDPGQDATLVVFGTSAGMGGTATTEVVEASKQLVAAASAGATGNGDPVITRQDLAAVVAGRSREAAAGRQGLLPGISLTADRTVAVWQKLDCSSPNIAYATGQFCRQLWSIHGRLTGGAGFHLAAIAEGVAQSVGLSLDALDTAARATQPYAIACLKGAFIGALGGPEGALIACATEAFAELAKEHGNRDARFVAFALQLRDIHKTYQAIRIAQKNPERPFDLWRQIIRKLSSDSRR